MIVVLTGASGFIGRRLAERLLERGHHVRTLVRPESVGTIQDLQPFRINYDRPESIVESGALNGADCLIHVAGLTKALTLEDFRRGNVTPVKSLLAAVRQANPPMRRFTLVSSQAAAGPALSPDRPVLETDPPAPFEPYGISKREAEQILEDPAAGIPYTIVRPSAVYGPRDVDFLSLFRQVRRGVAIYPANRRGRLATIHVDDLVSGILDATFEEAGKNETFFLTHEENLTWPEVYAAAARAVGAPLRVQVELPAGLVRLGGKVGDMVSRWSGRVSLMNSAKVAMGLAPYWTCSTEKARHLLNFTSSIDLEAGLAATGRWYREHGWL
jgi:nucleoside-diphosphate-sugar epimerase